MHRISQLLLSLFLILGKRCPNTELTELPCTDSELARLELTDILNALKDDEKQAVLLHIYGGLSHKDISNMLGISPAAAQKKYRRAINKLKNYFEVLTMNKRTIKKRFMRLDQLALGVAFNTLTVLDVSKLEGLKLHYGMGYDKYEIIGEYTYID